MLKFHNIKINYNNSLATQVMELLKLSFIQVLFGKLTGLNINFNHTIK